MAAPPARARADYDYLIKLLLIGDSGTILHLYPSESILCFIAWFGDYAVIFASLLHMKIDENIGFELHVHDYNQFFCLFSISNSVCSPFC